VGPVVDIPHDVAEELAQLRGQVAQLQHALTSRVVIEQAKGVLAERFSLTVEDAFALLRYSARSAQLKLHELARFVISNPATPPAVAIGLARGQRWRAAAQREHAEASRVHAGP
jgi:AmiR/NasT family two-component response regulator